METKNIAGQKLSVRLELSNGEELNLKQRAKMMLKSQDFKAWQREGDGTFDMLEEWIKNNIIDLVSRSVVVVREI